MWNHALINNFQPEWITQLCWKMSLLHTLFRRKLLNSWITEIFYSISKSPTAVFWVMRSSFSACHPSPSLKSFKPLTGPKGLGVSIRLSRMLNGRSSLGRSTSWTVTSQESTLYAGFLLQSRRRSVLDWCDSQTHKPLAWKTVLLLYHFALVFRSKGRLQSLQTFCVIWNRNYSCRKFPVVRSQHNCQSTFSYGLASFGRSYFIPAWLL